MGRIGQEGDTRPYRKLRRTDYYDSKAAFEAEKKGLTQHTSRGIDKWPRCSVCGQECRGVTFGVPPGDITCLRCWSE
jgi:hypothetical protein